VAEQDQIIQNIDSNGISAVANVVLTPEPGSMLLLSTGVLSIGLFAAFRRRSLGAPIASPNLR
jgi:hypothetical protein